MDLGNRGGRQRCRVDADEHVARQLRRDHLLDLLERNRRHLVDELPELLDVDVGQQVWARGEELAELDVSGAELLQRLPELLRTVARRGPVAPDPQLAQHAQEPAATGDAADVHGTLQPLGAGTHHAAYVPGISPGNATA